MTVRDLVACSLLPPGRRRTAVLSGVLAADPAGQPRPLVTTLEHVARETTRDAAGVPALVGRLRSEADAAIARGAAARLQPIGWVDDLYPARLRVIPDPPAVLWVRGNPSLLSHASVAVVGSRAASSYGLSVARQLGHDLARAGVAVVSGLARGCDGAAHQGALEAAGRTVAVVGCGADVTYPREHRTLSDEIAARGAIVSELVPGTPPLPVHFPLRNRIISGLSAAVVVVEASSRSGSLITVSCALEQGREVMAVPGNVLSDRHSGCHELLRDGACLVQCARDVLEALGWVDPVARERRWGRERVSEPLEGTGQVSGPAPVPLAEAAAAEGVLALLTPGEELDLDTLAERSGRKMADLLPELMRLELAGDLRRVEGGRFVRSGR